MTDFTAHNPFGGEHTTYVEIEGRTLQVDGADMPTFAQMRFLATLLDERDYSGHQYADRVGEIDRAEGKPVTFAGASALITELKTCPSAEAANTTDVPAGRYAVENSDGDLRFYKVDTPTEGRWAGHVFVAVQASDDMHPVRGRAKGAVLAKIADDPAEASARYGREIGRCGLCGRTLTDEDSRARGIGPVCADKHGW